MSISRFLVGCMLGGAAFALGQPPVGSDTTKSPVTTSNNAPTS